MTFALDLQKFAQKAKGRADDAVGLIVVGVAREIDKRSPVGNPDNWDEGFKKAAESLGWIGPGYVGGRFRANWQLGIGSIPAGVVNAVDPDGSATVSAIIAGVPQDAAGKVYFLANNLPYARALEDGYSKQAPAGIVGVTSVMFQSIVNDAVKALP